MSPLTVALLGDPGGGKTSLKKRLIGKSFDSNEKITVGADYSFFSLDEHNNIKLKICDIAGQASFEMVRQNYFRGADAALLIFDLTNASSLENLQMWILEFIKANDDTYPPILLVGNKSDLEDDRQISLKSVKEFLQIAKDHPHIDGRITGFIETSAKTGHNVRECFDKITRTVVGV